MTASDGILAVTLKYIYHYMNSPNPSLMFFGKGCYSQQTRREIVESFLRMSSLENVRRAPALIFDRKDELLHKLLYQTFEEVPASIPTHYVPSVEKYAEFIALGHAYGSLPDQQSKPLVHTGQMVDLSPDCHVSAKLFWHCWNLKSDVLEKLTQNLIRKAKILLKE